MTDSITNAARKKSRYAEGEVVKAIDRSGMKRPAFFGGASALFESGLIAEFVRGSGQYVMLPKGARLINAVRTMLSREIGTGMGFEEIILPKAAPLDTFRKAGLLGRWDSYLISATPYSSTKGVTDSYILDPLQCTALYQFLENRVYSSESLPLKWLDSSGPTYRNEDSDRLEPLIRQREFHRSEFVYIGSRKQVTEARGECISRMESMCAELGLGYRIVVGSGCYQVQEGELESPKNTDEIPILDIEVYCPDMGGGTFLEVAGCAVLAAMITSRFNIRGEDGQALWSGCTGIGLERMAYAIIANHGTDSAYYPDIIREAMA